MPYYNNDGTVMTKEQEAAVSRGLPPIVQYNMAANQQRALAPINAQETDDIAAANTQQSGALNTAALAGSRRRAGGTTFRRRGSAVSANELVSGLGTANAKALAQQRRANAISSGAASSGGGALGGVGLGGGGANGLQMFNLW